MKLSIIATHLLLLGGYLYGTLESQMEISRNTDGDDRAEPESCQVATRQNQETGRNVACSLREVHPRHGVTFKITAYCSCRKCCGHSHGITASKKRARPGFVAADVRVLPMGTRLRISGIAGSFVVMDTGKAIKGNRIDIWLPSHRAAKAFGVKYRTVEILE